MKITNIQVIPFATTIDYFSNGKAHPDKKIIQTVIIATDKGVEGHFFGGHFHGDRNGLLAEERALINQYLKIPWIGRKFGNGASVRKLPRTF